MPRRALITGITGQDGAYLTHFLLKKGYEVHGVIRRASSFNTQRLASVYRDPHDPRSRFRLHYGDMLDGSSLRGILRKVKPQEVYNLAAQSHVKVSFDQPEYTADVVAMGTLRLLEALRDYQVSQKREIRMYQAGSSEMFGNSPPRQHEGTPFLPKSPYAASKVAAHHYAVNYRDAYGLFVANGILFNHESPLRGETFVTRKITRAATRIKRGLQKEIYLGNLQAHRDWGFAGDYVESMWKMLQQDRPDDFVVATGRMRSVKEFLQATFDRLDLDWKDHVRIDPRYFRPADVEKLEGDASKARRQLRWRPRMEFEALVDLMVASDMQLANQERILKDAGHPEPNVGAFHGAKF